MNHALRLAFVTLGSLVALLLVAAGALYAISGRRLAATHDVPLTDTEWERAIRHGVRRDGTGLIVMPSEVFHAIADDEMAAMIAYLKQLPPVDREVPRAQLRIIGRMLMGTGHLQTTAALTSRTPHVATVDTTPGLGYGRYVVAKSGCAGCHGTSFAGGKSPDPNSPPASNLTPTGIGAYTEADFIHTLRTGVRPNGVALKEAMPWKYYGRMSDEALRSIYLFLKALPPKQFGEM